MKIVYEIEKHEREKAFEILIKKLLVCENKEIGGKDEENNFKFRIIVCSN